MAAFTFRIAFATPLDQLLGVEVVQYNAYAGLLNPLQMNGLEVKICCNAGNFVHDISDPNNNSGLNFFFHEQQNPTPILLLSFMQSNS